jgi:hypothetical protein
MTMTRLMTIRNKTHVQCSLTVLMLFIYAVPSVRALLKVPVLLFRSNNLFFFGLPSNKDTVPFNKKRRGLMKARCLPKTWRLHLSTPQNFSPKICMHDENN